ncbi:hypothetical protein CF326_g1711 [Tilletia indica]|nr:hypothetical protein CF326_g1711 [Tilletia indica]
MAEVTEETNPFIRYWRRTDLPHLSLHDRIHWVMQWVFNDPTGVLHGGRPATIADASQELVWIARQFGQEPEPYRPTLDEYIAHTRREDARRARVNNIHRIGRSSFKYKGKHRHGWNPAHASPTAMLTTPSTVEGDRSDDGNDDESRMSQSGSSSAAVSDYLPAQSSSINMVSDDHPADNPMGQLRLSDGVSLQTMADARSFRIQQRAARKSDSEDSVSETSVAADK